MRYIKKYNQFKNDNKGIVNEEFIGDIIKNIFNNIKNKASLKLSKMFGGAKEADKIFTEYETELDKINKDKYQNLKNYLDYEKQVISGKDKDDNEKNELIKKVIQARKLYEKNLDIVKKKMDLKINNLLSTEKDQNIKQYIQLKRLELQQSMISKELDVVNKELGDDILKEHPEILKNIGADGFENILKEANTKIKNLTAEIQKSENDKANGGGDFFDLAKAKSDKEYSWGNSPFIESYEFEAGEQLKYWSNENFKSEGEDYAGTVGWVSSDDKQKESNSGIPIRKDQLWITTNKSDLNSGFVINKGKIISTDKHDKELESKKSETDNNEEENKTEV